ncbi:MAG: GMC family oxidoreductase N-terminal domain-containing protein [Bauldia sp.]|uniref:GMC family oxidoreductase n=1 Tax=Bauldia sp. TaxID=2575872 RepID=UPI001D861FFC|nr:GMC family oxidoreductase N-terminal domain-containing protein [Bauldia sp.]MCB1497809.1 GMC family oxidoreductase N-terminal domain-containing protein [Bauldia sp.]
MSETPEADYLIVGGGSAGCVLASRLSEDSGSRVVLVEAGRDLTEETMPPELRSGFPGRAYLNRAYLWPNLSATLPSRGANDPSRDAGFYEQARILGGGSSINGIGANRGSPSDYDEWRDMGLDGWSFDEVLPFFKRLERDLDIDDAFHGQDGPLPIRRLGAAIWTPFTHAMMTSFVVRGIPYVADQNGRWEDGVFEMALNVDEKRERVPTALAYLSAEVRRRPNLEVRTGLTVERIILEGRRAVGVATRSDGGASSELRGREIIVSSGALASPALLMRSGIGPAAHLSDCGIEVRQDLPGVGQNLMEHPSAGVMAFLKPQARQPYEAYYHIPIAIRYSSKVEGCPVGDMHMNIMTRASWHQIGRQFAPLFFWVNKSYSRGQLMLDPKAPAGPPRVDFRMLSDQRDVQRLADAFEYAMVLLADPVVTPIIEAIYPVELSERARGYTYPTRRNAIITDLLSRMLDIGAGVRKLALPKMMEGVPSAHRLAADRQELEAYLKEKVGGVWHPSGTCRMGAPGDRMAVTGKDGRVRGIAGLRVCDASIMPTIPCANTNVPVIMIAEKIAQDIRDTEGMAGQG